MAITPEFIKDVEGQKLRSLQYEGDMTRLPNVFRNLMKVGLPTTWEHLKEWPIVCECGGVQQFFMGLSFTQFSCPICRNSYWPADVVSAILDVFKAGGWERNHHRIIDLVLSQGQYGAHIAKALSTISGLGLKEEVMTDVAKDVALYAYDPAVSSTPVKAAELDTSWLKAPPPAEGRVEPGKRYRRRDILNSLTLHTLVISEVGTDLYNQRFRGLSIEERRDKLTDYMSKAGTRVTFTQFNIPHDIIDDELITCTSMSHHADRNQISVKMLFVDSRNRTYEVTEIERIR
jgi:hypothetical protein